MVKILSSAAWPGVDRSEARAACGLCGSAWSVYHAVYECDALALDRRQIAPNTLLKAAAAVRGEGAEASERFARGLLPHPRSIVPAASEEGTVAWYQRPATGLLEGTVFTDGSVLGVNQGVPRAGWAAVQVDANGACVAAVYGSVPRSECPSQSIADAEDYALAMLGTYSIAPLEVYVDRQQTVDDAVGGRVAGCSARHPRAHLWVRYFAAFDDGDIAVRKTRAHATLADVHRGVTTHSERRANGLADQFAKLGAGLHGTHDGHRASIKALALLAQMAVQWATYVYILTQRRLPQRSGDADRGAGAEAKAKMPAPATPGSNAVLRPRGAK